MSTETLGSHELDELCASSEKSWLGFFALGDEEALSKPLPPTIFETVAIDDLPTADKRPATTPTTQTKTRVPTGKDNSDSVEITTTDIGSD